MTVRELIALLGQVKNQNLSVTCLTANGEELPIAPTDALTLEGGGAAPAFLAINVG